MEIHSISSLIFSIFVGNKNTFALQDSAGAYHTKYSKITTYTVKHMLENKLSILTYQMVNARQIKWNCLDFDIPKHIIEADDYAENKGHYFDELFYDVSAASNILSDLKINHLIEFSGNRGVHIWILFDEYVSKELGYTINKTLLEKIKLKPSTNIDLFPTTAKLSEKGIGQGVKLPLSYHSKSKSYSYLIESITDFSFSDDIFINEIDTPFLVNQLKILENIVYQSPMDIIKKLGITIIGQTECLDRIDYIRTKKIWVGDSNLNLDAVIAELSKCSMLKSIFAKFRLGVSERERIIIVGLLSRLQNKSNQNLGKDLLQEFFSRMPNYREELTKKKLNDLKLLPISCSHLKSTNPKYECTCSKTDILSPIELLEGAQLIPPNPFDVTKPEMARIVKSAVKYTNQNDEVALFSIINDLENADIDMLCSICSEHLHEVKAINTFYTFKRLEDEKERTLISLNATDKVVTKFFIKSLHAYYYSGFSENNYGYKFNYSLANNYIFYPWLQQWNIFTKQLDSIINDEFMSHYYLIKLDIKSFYDSIDRQILKIKLFEGPTTEIRAQFKKLDETAISKIRIICETLITFSASTTKEKKGVPQGPAFARYLAEVYLMDFDRFIEYSIAENLGLYLRYVDDIFIIVDNKIFAEEMQQKAITFLKGQNLEVNSRKSFIGYIRDYRKLFNEYVDKTKYSIDHTNINLDTNLKVSKSVKELFGLLKKEGSESINTANL